MNGSVSNQPDRSGENLNGRILDELREGARTQAELVTALDEPRERVRSRLQFLAGAGYIESSGEERNRYELRDDPRELGVFEEYPSLRPVAFGAVLLLSGSLYYVVLRQYLPTALETIVPPILAVATALPLALVTARIVIAPSGPHPNAPPPIQRSHEADEMPGTNESER